VPEVVGGRRSVVKNKEGKNGRRKRGIEKSGGKLGPLNCDQ
jgi:hypothetical protein